MRYQSLQEFILIELIVELKVLHQSYKEKQNLKDFVVYFAQFIESNQINQFLNHLLQI